MEFCPQVVQKTDAALKTPSCHTQNPTPWKANTHIFSPSLKNTFLPQCMLYALISLSFYPKQPPLFTSFLPISLLLSLLLRLCPSLCLSLVHVFTPSTFLSPHQRIHLPLCLCIHIFLCLFLYHLSISTLSGPWQLVWLTVSSRLLLFSFSFTYLLFSLFR